MADSRRGLALFQHLQHLRSIDYFNHVQSLLQTIGDCWLQGLLTRLALSIAESENLRNCLCTFHLYRQQIAWQPEQGDHQARTK